MARGTANVRAVSVHRQLRAAHVVLSGLVAGGDVSSLAAVYPAVDTLPREDRLRAGQAINRGFGRVMQPLVIATIVSGAGALALGAREPDRPAFRLGLGATGCHLAMLGVTLGGIAPINARMLAASDDPAGYASYTELRARWNRLHAVRVGLELAALALAASSAVAR